MIVSFFRTRSRSRSRSGPKCRSRSRSRYNHLKIKILTFINIFVTTIISQTVACPVGWFGPSCVFKDLRYRSQKIIIDNEASNPSDGRSCVDLSAGTKSIDIEIHLPMTIVWIRATLRNKDSFSEFSLVFKTEDEEIIQCLEQKMVVHMRQIDVKCKASGELIQNVILRGSFNTTCDIFVSGGRDLTYGGIQTEIGGHHVGASVIEDCFSSNDLTHCHISSNDGDSFLRIDLSSPAIISSFYIETPGNSWVYGSTYNISFINADVSFRFLALFYLNNTLNESVPLDQPVKTFIITHIHNRGSLKLSDVQLFGSFVCEHGRYGTMCEHDCRCLNLTAECFPETGGCPDGCSAGVQGLNCSMPCEDFTFGSNCKSSCHNCMSSCNKETGSCQSCKAGFYGRSCRKICSEHCSGKQCTKESGNCANCELGYFGAHCDSKCCAGCGSRCEKATGNCAPCHNGYSGRNCCTECLPGTYGTGCVRCPRNCFNYACLFKNGTCRQSLCKAGFRGAKCEQECPLGTWGLNCNRTCSSHCDGECQHTNGYCLACKDNYLLPRCDALCPPGAYGKDCKHNCSNCLHPPCNDTDGRCPGSLCQAGWQREKCDRPCVSGTWGINCTRECSPNCAKIGQCNHLDGHCLGGCTKGFFPPLCVDTFLVCPDHAWGKICDRTCSFYCAGKGNCQRDNGACLSGCKGHYVPPTCQLRKRFDNQPDSPSSAFKLDFSTIFWLAVAMFIVVVTACNCVYIFYMRKKR